MAKRTSPGDVVRVGHAKYRVVVAHYLSDVPEKGPLVQVYMCPDDWNIDCGFSACSKPFPPVFVGIGHATKSGRWTVIGRISIESLAQPPFLVTNTFAGHPGEWWLEHGQKERKLGLSVPSELQNCEVAVVWSAELLEERIQSGINPFSYEAFMAFAKGR